MTSHHHTTAHDITWHDKTFCNQPHCLTPRYLATNHYFNFIAHHNTAHHHHGNKTSHQNTTKRNDSRLVHTKFGLGIAPVGRPACSLWANFFLWLIGSFLPVTSAPCSPGYYWWGYQQCISCRHLQTSRMLTVLKQHRRSYSSRLVNVVSS